MPQFHKLTIKEVKKETKDAVSIVFDVPEKLKETYKFQAGQYVTLKKDIEGDELRRAYSICSDPNSGILKIAVKAVDGGTFSVYANNMLHAGDKIEVSEPEGRFVIAPEKGKHYLGIAVGSGITPILSMIKATMHPEAHFTLIYGNKSVEDTIFKSRLDDLKNIYSTQLDIHYVYSREEVAGTLSGRIDADKIKYILGDTTFEQAFICGPERMIHDATDALVANGFDKDDVKFELFSVPVEKNDDDSVPEGNTEITVVLDDEETTFIMPKNKMILNAALDKDLDPPYSCQGGICSSCLCKVVEGKAEMKVNQILSEEEVAEGMILSCQAQPVTPTIKVDFDDV